MTKPQQNTFPSLVENLLETKPEVLRKGTKKESAGYVTVGPTQGPKSQDPKA